MTDHYSTLDVPKDATPEQIKTAYRRKAQKSHPDQGGDPEQFKTIALAYEVLSNPDRRKKYDETGSDQHRAGMTEAMALVCQAFERALELNDSPDLIKRTAEIIRANIKDIKSGIHEASTKLAKLRKKRGKLKHNETLYDPTAFELIEGILDHKINGLKAAIDERERALKIVDEAIEMLDGIECCDDEDQGSNKSNMMFRMYADMRSSTGPTGGHFRGWTT